MGKFMRKIVMSPTWRMVQQTSRELRTLPNRMIREAGMEEDLKELDQLGKDVGNQIGSLRKPFSAAASEAKKELEEAQSDLNAPVPAAPAPAAPANPPVLGGLAAWTTPPPASEPTAEAVEGLGPETVIDAQAGQDSVSAPVLGEHPDILRVLSGVFDRPTLPSRAELRLTSTDTVVGYSLSLVRSEAGVVMGATLFFKDLTYVKQMEERERLRDRLAAVGEMAAVMAHEIKNPLAGIEVLAGLVRRKTPDIPEAQALVADIISEAKMANAIVQEVLEFVRPVRLQVEPTSLRESLANAISMAEACHERKMSQIRKNRAMATSIGIFR